ncbi:MAG: aldo/keto reductase [Alphaproteobacteria bacterium]|nr:aldo/keto reductase [Alphaproteobacteria bacterium]
MKYNRCGRSGLLLPAISLGLWHNFGAEADHGMKRALCRKAWDLGITHFDLANNYGPPPGSAEEAFGHILAEDFNHHRDQMIISTKAGYHMWDGPYGEWGSRKYMLASLDQSLKRLGLAYVDIFYSHRFDPDTPLEETMGALDYAVRSGRALYVGISNYPTLALREAARILKELGTPCLIHQPRYNMLQREPEISGALETAATSGMGTIVFSPLSQGLLTNKYLKGIPEGSRATVGKFLKAEQIEPALVAKLAKLNAIAASREQTLAQMAIAWVLREKWVTSALIGASRPEQIDDCVAALKVARFSPDELQEIEAVLTT